jgi:hypothetical protein
MLPPVRINSYTVPPLASVRLSISEVYEVDFTDAHQMGARTIEGIHRAAVFSAKKRSFSADGYVPAAIIGHEPTGTAHLPPVESSTLHEGTTSWEFSAYVKPQI